MIEFLGEVAEFITKHIPHGSGVNYYWTWWVRKNGTIVLKNKFDVMNENGLYDWVMPFQLVITIERDGKLELKEIIADETLRKSGYGVKGYLEEVYYHALNGFKLECQNIGFIERQKVQDGVTTIEPVVEPVPLLGYYSLKGYEIRQGGKVLYEAGNNKYDSASTQSVPIDHEVALSKDVLYEYCRQTGENMAKELNTTFAGVAFSNDVN
jgi:hypothetical protein